MNANLLSHLVVSWIETDWTETRFVRQFGGAATVYSGESYARWYKNPTGDLLTISMHLGTVTITIHRNEQQDAFSRIIAAVNAKLAANGIGPVESFFPGFEPTGDYTDAQWDDMRERGVVCYECRGSVHENARCLEHLTDEFRAVEGQ